MDTKTTTKAAPADPVADTQEQTHGPHQIIAVLGELQNGHCLDNLERELRRVVRGVADSKTGKGGTVALTIRVEPLRKGNIANRAMILQGVIVSKAPEDPPDNNVFFFDDNGGLHLQDPDQHQLFTGPKR
jgi:hypothetical protein